MILGDVRDGRPFVRASIELTRIGVVRNLDFLLDTGSDASFIGPESAIWLGVDYQTDYQGRSPSSSIGIGGTSDEYPESAFLTFTHHDDAQEYVSLRIGVVVPTRQNVRLPPILGLDFLRYFRLTFERSTGLLRLDEPVRL